MKPPGAVVWNSFWKREREEKHRRTRSLREPRGLETCLLERFLRVEERLVSEGELAQKHVTKITSCRADSMAGRIVAL